jgi:hypothetical protein
MSDLMVLVWCSGGVGLYPEMWEFFIFLWTLMRRGGDERGYGDHVRQEMISRDYVKTSGGDLLLLLKNI